MEALILSCGTGGGHNAAGRALCEELTRRGHHAVMLDPYTLRSSRIADAVSWVYIKMVQRIPHLFGFVYFLGEIVRLFPGKSPVYFANRKTARALGEYLKEHPCDVIIAPHVFPAEMLTALKRWGQLSAFTVFVATDYECIPFTEETECDAYVIPAESLKKTFRKRGIDGDRLYPLGIPVSPVYYEPMDAAKAKKALGLREDMTYFLLAGGSIGAGKLYDAVRTVKHYYKNRPEVCLIVICGNNERLYRRMKKLADERCRVLRQTNQMALYMKACSAYLSKAGGLSSTEAATVGIPLIHIPSIPGCESKNSHFFAENHMSIAVADTGKSLVKALDYLKDKRIVQAIREAGQSVIPEHATGRICDWLEKTVAERQSDMVQ